MESKRENLVQIQKIANAMQTHCSEPYLISDEDDSATALLMRCACKQMFGISFYDCETDSVQQ